MAHGLQNALLAWSTLLLVQAKNWDVFYADAVPQDWSGFSFVLHNQRVWYFGGYPMTITVESQLTRFNDLYCFETRKPENWAHVIAEGTPPAMAGHSAIVDKSGRMWIFGGSTGSGLLYDIYHINLADAKCEPGNSGKWTKVSTKNPPAARSSHSAVYHGGRMWVFGGWLGGDAPYSNEHTLSADVHYLDLEASTWSVVEPHGWKPMARYAHQALMGADGRMWIYGGYNINGTKGVAMVALDRLYCFDTDKRIWSALTAAGSVPNYLGYPFVAMDAAGRMWMGGGAISSTEVNANLFYLDTLSTDVQWKEVEDFKSDVDGPPLNRIGAGAVMEANGNMWIVGGSRELRQQLPLCRLATAVQAPTTATTTTTPRPEPGTYIWIILLVVLLCIIILGGLLFLRKRRNLKLLQERQDPQQVEMGEAGRA